MSVLREFLVMVGFKNDEKSLKKVEEGLKRVGKAVTAFAGAIAAAVTLVAAFVNSVANKYSALSTLSKQVNATTEEILRMSYVAKATGSSVEALQTSLRGLNQKIGEAIKGGGEGVKIFQRLGISLKDANGQVKSTAVIMDELRASMRGLSSAEQVSILQKLGIDPSMIGMLTQDVSELSEEFNHLYRSAGYDANKAAEEADKFTESMSKLGFIFQIIKDAVGVAFMGKIREGIESLMKWLLFAMPKIIEAIKPIIDIVLRVATAFFATTKRIITAVDWIIDKFNSLDKKTITVIKTVAGLVAGWMLLNKAFAMSPIGRLILLGVLIAGLAEDYLTFQQGGKSFIDWNSKLGRGLVWTAKILGTLAAAYAVVKTGMIAYTAVMTTITAVTKAARAAMLIFNIALWASPIILIIMAVIAAIALLVYAGYKLWKNWDKVKEFFASLWEGIKEGASKIWAAITAPFKAAYDFVVEIWEGILGFFSGLFGGEGAGSIFTGFGDMIGGIFTGAVNTVMGVFNGFSDFLGGFFDWAGDGLSGIFEGIKNAGSWIAGKAGAAWDWVVGNDTDQGVPPPVMTAASSQQHPRFNPDVNQRLQTETTINVYGSNDPKAVGDRVLGQQDRAAADQARYFERAVQ